MDRADHVAVHVQLQLPPDRVPDPHRPRAPPAVELELLLRHPGASAHPVEVAELRSLRARRAHQPPEERVRLVVVPEISERLEREARITRPRVAVVPVQLAARLFRERSRRRGDDRAGRGVDEQLEQQCAPDHLVAPGPVVPRLPAPALPEPASPFEALFDSLSRRKHERLPGRGREREQRGLAGLGDERARHLRVRDSGGARPPGLQHQCVVPAARVHDPAPLLDQRPGEPVAEPGRESPRDLDAPGDGRDPADELA